MSCKIRSEKSELLDQPGIPGADIQRNLYELSVINRTLGGHQVTVQGFKRLAGSKKNIHVCEIGCGGGDNLKAIEKKGSAPGSGLSISGIDINADCVNVAEKTAWKVPSRFIISNYIHVRFETPPDIIFSSLFCHHFKEADLVSMFRWMNENSRLGFFINDLHRHPLAYYSIKWLTRAFSNSYLVKNDAPLSVLRGFKKKELEELLAKAGIHQFSIHWKWAFRWLIVVKK